MHLSDTLQDIHPDKLQSVLESHLQSGNVDALRQALPSLITLHPSMAPQLQAMLQQLRTKHSAPSAQAHGLNNLELISGADGKVFNCANCGGSVSRQSPGSQQIICHFCGCDSENPAVDGLSQWAKKLHADSRFSIGSFFSFNGVRWQAIGVQSFSGKIREWDSEDKVWESNSATYTLWWMINQQREIAWLSDYGKKRYWSEKYLPKKPALPKEKNKKIEYGSWRLQFAAGEFSYQPQVNEKRSTWEYLTAPDKHEEGKNKQGKKYTFAVEASVSEGGVATEYEFVRSVTVSNKEVLEGLGDDKSLSDVARWKKTASVFLATLVALGASYFAMLQLQPATLLWTKNIALTTTEDIALGQISAEEAGTVVQLVARLPNPIPAQRYLELDVDIYDTDGEIAGGYFVEFWHETGTDSDGSWDESRYKFSNTLRFDEPGNYEVMATVAETNTRLPVDLEVRALSNPVLPDAFIGAAIAAVLFTVLSFLTARSKASGNASIGARISKVKRAARKKA